MDHVLPNKSTVPGVCLARALGLAFLLGLVGAPALQAQDTDEVWSFNTYGTLGLAHASESRADYVPDPFRSKGSARSDDWTFSTDSVLGLQLGVRPSERLSAVVQVVVEQQFDGSWSPDLEWANVQYDHSNSLSVRLGRIALGTYLVSDYRKVGYALPWVRPPADLYHIVSITNSDGIDLGFRHQQGETHYLTQIVYGRNDMDELDGFLEAPNLWSLRSQVDRGPWTLHASYTSVKLRLHGFRPLWHAFETLGPAGDIVVRTYDGDGDWAPFLAAGMRYDPGPWFLMAEWGRADTVSAFGSRHGWYISAGHRMGAFTPYATFARAGGRFEPAQGVEAAVFPPPVQPTINELNWRLLALQQSIITQQRTVSAGLRWDVTPGISIKTQYDRVKVERGSFGTFSNREPGYRPDGAHVFSMTLDFTL